MNHLVFDLDGTLADTSKGIFHAFCDASIALDLFPPSYDLFKSFIGPPISLICERIYGSDLNFELFIYLFRNAYDNCYYKEYVFYDSVVSSLAKLRCLGFSFSVVTNKPTAPACSIIQDLSKLSSDFNPVIGVDFFETNKYPQHSFKSFSIRYISDFLGVPLSKMCYVGDSISDYYSSLDAGINFVGCSYGFDISISNANLFPVINTFATLPFLISQYD